MLKISLTRNIRDMELLLYFPPPPPPPQNFQWTSFVTLVSVGMEIYNL